MIEPRSVAHFSIAVSDPDASRKFYTEILGLKYVQTSPVCHAFKIDSDKYEDAKAFLTAKGVEVFDEEDRTKGVFIGRQFYIRDPDNTVIEFTEWDGTSRLD